MDIGSGVFLGLLSIGLVWLYVSTRERWRWKRIVAWCAAIILVPSALLGGWSWYDNYQSSQPRFQDTLWDLRPGMTPGDVLFAKGEPKTKTDERWLYYKDADFLAYFVTWRNGRVRAIAVIATEGKNYYLPSLPGISNSDSLEDIEKKLGKPDFVSRSKDDTMRMVTYLRYGLFLRLVKNELMAIGVLDPKEGPMRFAEEAPSPSQ